MFALTRRLAFSLFFCLFFFLRMLHCEEPVLHLYTWSDYVTKPVIEAFEKETGIHVIHDVYDSNDVLEAKLLTGSSRYDLVCPSAWPYVGPQIQAGVYQPLDLSKLPNRRHLDPFLMKKLDGIDQGNRYLLPYLWGVTGIGYNKAAVKKCLPNMPVDSLDVLFNPTYVKPLSKCGISLLDEAVDVIPLALLYLGFDPNSQNTDELYQAAQLLEGIKPHVSRFGVYQSSHDLSTGELCLILGWSQEVFKAKEAAAEGADRLDIGFSVPREGTSMWVDVFAIPIGAPHPDNAHKFMDFLMRPRIAAQISNELSSATAVVDAYPYVNAKVRGDSTVYPSRQMREKLFVDKVMSQEFVRLRSRIWLDVKSGRLQPQALY